MITDTSIAISSSNMLFNLRVCNMPKIYIFLFCFV